jgi:hypothetical protein
MAEREISKDRGLLNPHLPLASPERRAATLPVFLLDAARRQRDDPWVPSYAGFFITMNPEL